MAHSGFFRVVLEELEPDAVLYLRGLDDRDLDSLLDLLYIGRATVPTSRVARVVWLLEGMQVPGLVVQDSWQEADAQELQSLSNITDPKDFLILHSAETSELVTVKEETASRKNPVIVTATSSSSQLKEEKPRLTFSLGAEDMAALKQLWMALVTRNKEEKKSVFQCKECGKKSLKLWNIYHHVDFYHLPHVQHKCDGCQQVFSNHSALKMHVGYKHAFTGKYDSKEASEIKCSDCDFTTKTHTSLANHRAWNHDSNIVMCDVCSEKFPGREKLMLHKRRAHGGKKQCPHCEGSYSNLLKHKKIMHTDDKDKPYSCLVCEKGFIDKSRITAHMRSAHTGEKPFPCRFLCGTFCSEAGNRKKHEVKRHGKEWTKSS